jgi:hypothetical protein
MLFSGIVELFLNLAWFVLSAVLVGICLRRQSRSARAWVAVTALCLLVLLLLPTISMTDDLLAISTPAEAEHMLRHHAPWAMHAGTTGVNGTWALLTLLLMLASPERIAFWRRRGGRGAVKLLSGFVRCCTVRPPPAAQALAIA